MGRSTSKNADTKLWDVEPGFFLWKLCDVVTWPKERSRVLLRTATGANFLKYLMWPSVFN